MKVYIIDDNLILSGANLSEEYFVDRVDRYLWIQQGGNGLVDFYANVFSVLCEHASMYSPVVESRSYRTSERRRMMKTLSDLFTTASSGSETDHANDDDEDIVAYAVPTLQAPSHFLRGIPIDQRMPLDVPVLERLLKGSLIPYRQVDGAVASGKGKLEIRLASAYLNLTTRMQQCLAMAGKTHMLTAGRISHGFLPKPNKTGNKGRDWIPTAFDFMARASTRSRQMFLWFYQRPGWTFHSKGLWMTWDETLDEKENQQEQLRIKDASSLLLITHGSSNYGQRSTHRDMESNLFLVFPDSVQSLAIKKTFTEEWNQYADYAQPSDQEEQRTLPWRIRMALPFFRSFF